MASISMIRTALISLMFVSIFAVTVVSADSSTSKSYEDAKSKFVDEQKNSEEQFKTDCASQKMSQADARESFDERTVDILLRYANELLRLSSDQEADIDASNKYLTESGSVLAVIKEKVLVAKWLEQLAEPSTVPSDAVRTEAFNSDPLSNYREFCRNLVNSINKLPISSVHKSLGFAKTVSVADDYKIDLRKTDSLVSPFVGILEIHASIETDSDTATEKASQTSANKDYRLKIAAQNGKWCINQIEEHDADTDDFKDLSDYRFAKLLAQGLRPIPNP